MKRFELAGYSLLASAFVLAGLLIVQMQNHSVLATANAEMVLNRGNITLMTAKTRPNEEAIFVLENTTAKLLVYRVDAGRKRIDLARSAELAPWIRAASSGSSSGSRDRAPR